MRAKVHREQAMDITKASWRLKSPRGKLQAIRKLRPDRANKDDLLIIATSDPDERVRAAAAKKLCSLGSIAAFIKEDLFVSWPSHGEDERSYALLDALLESITDDNALFDIVMHGFFSLPEKDREHEDCPSWFRARARKSWEMQERAAIKIQSQEMLRSIVGNCGTVDLSASACSNTLRHITDHRLLRDIVQDDRTDVHLAITAAGKLRDDDFLAAVGRDLRHHDIIRLDAVEKISDGDLRTATLLTILENPQPDGSKFDPEARLSALGKSHLQDAAIRPYYEAIARDQAYDMDVRIDADMAAVKYGGASCLNEIYAQALAGSSQPARDKACGEGFNGHRWRYNGTVKTEHDYDRNIEKEEFRCAICGEKERYSDPRAQGHSKPSLHLDDAQSVKSAALDAISDEKSLVGLLEHETEAFAIRKIVSKISDTETLLDIAQTNPNAETRKEAVLEAYEREHAVLSRMDGEELLCILGKHVTDPDDMRYTVERIQDEQCLLEIGSLMLKRRCVKLLDIYMDALAKVSDQTKLTDLFTKSLGCRIRSFELGVLNQISDPRLLGHLWLDGARFRTPYRLIEAKIVNPKEQFRELQSYDYSFMEKAIDIMASDPVLQKKMVEHCYAGTHHALGREGRMQRILDKLPAGSRAARKLRDKMDSRILSPLEEIERDRACREDHNGHRWRYKGTKYFRYTDSLIREKEEYVCMLCGKTHCGEDPRPGSTFSMEYLLEDLSPKVAALEEITDDEILVGLLENERYDVVIRKIISLISDTETLLDIARTNSHFSTRKEAVLEAYERDHGILSRVNEEYLLCVLGKYVSDPDDLLYLIDRITDEKCLIEIGSLMMARQCDSCRDIYLAALAKVTDQTHLCQFFYRAFEGSPQFSEKLQPFIIAVLNLIRDPRVLVHIWMNEFVDMRLREMVEEKIVNPTVQFKGLK